jgi:hypothetical protein
VELLLDAARSGGRLLPPAALACLALGHPALAQDLYKSRAEMMNAEALSKQADATIINAVAGYGKTRAEVAKLNQDTREKSVQNHLLESKVYYEKRAQYDAHRDAHAPEPATQEEHVARARRSAPPKLSPYELWSQPGVLRWPTLLKGRVYADARAQVDDLLANRTAEDSGAGSQNCVSVQAWLTELKASLVRHVRHYPSGDYLAARKFLEAVGRAAQEPLSTGSPGGAPSADKVASH